MSQVQLLLQTIQLLVLKQAVKIIPDPVAHPGFYSPVFLVPKNDLSKFCMIHNLAVFNKWTLVKQQHLNNPELEALIQAMSH